ncbi:MAG: sigma 54-interacting transcriptional regulator [Desulfobacteraceae bacterium]|nr:sigma 54-interacting transcriptional regulator [Desulfobacteraceae bacterium]
MSTLQHDQELATLTCLYEITKVLASSTDLHDCLKRSLAILAAYAGLQNGAVTLINPKSGQLEIEVAHTMSAEARKRGVYDIGEGITGRVVATGSPIIVPQVSKEPLFLNRTRTRSNLTGKPISFLCVPIKHGKGTIGSLSVDCEYKEGANYEEKIRFLTIVSGLFAQTATRIQAFNQEKEQLLNENNQLRKQLSDKYRIDTIVSNSSRMQEVLEMTTRVADSNATVLLRGESGTGKTMVAKAIHFNSKRAPKPFIAVNCSALPETLLESELFGHEKGAFTGASSLKKGRFEAAEGGTLFLDEIGELSLAIQVKLLNVVQDREFQRLGSTTLRKCNVRLVAATNKDLEHAVAHGSFREDFYYRLNVFPIYIPPLRERRTDILLLAEYFLQKYNQENKKNVKRISTSAIDLLVQYHWPGNVRELQNCMERALLICDEDTIKSYHLPPTLQSSSSINDNNPLSFSSSVEIFEKELIFDALKRFNGNQSKAAEYLDTSLRIINYKIHKYKIDTNMFKIVKT